MIIDKNSFHFKLVDFFWSYRTYDLCTYIRRVLILSVILPLVFVFAILLISLLGTSFFVMVGVLPTDVDSMTLGNFVMGFFTGIPTLAFLAFIFYMFADMLENNFGIYKDDDAPKREPGLIRSYIKSQSENYCASIEYKD